MQWGPWVGIPGVSEEINCEVSLARWGGEEVLVHDRHSLRGNSTCKGSAARQWNSWRSEIQGLEF